jgi:LAS superfamily LD-carboxypeptidase LdcB
MVANARTPSGINFNGGGWRSYETQVKLRKDRGCPSEASSTCPGFAATAPAGTSNHEVGAAIDLNYNGGQAIAGAAWTWLTEYAIRFGMYNLVNKTYPEPWHWSSDGH